MDAGFRAEFPTCEKKDILITHATLAYFCKEYGCNQVPIQGVAEEGEPSAAGIARIIDQARARNITVVFFESLINPATAEAIAQEIHGTTAVFNTMHGLTAEQQAAGDDYITLLRANLQTVKKSLVCSYNGNP